MEHPPPRGAPYGHAAAAFGAVLALYVVTLAPTTWFWDTSEYIASAHILGIPHPPGSPLFVLIGNVWSALWTPSGLSVAVRMNLLAAVCSALATGFFFLVTHRVLSGWLEREGRGGSGAPGRLARALPLVGAWTGSMLGGAAYTVWNQSNVSEKVYPISLLVIATVSWIALLWLDRKDRRGSEWLLVLATYLLALGSTNHLMSVLPAPALLTVVLMEKPRVLLNRGLITHGVTAVILGLSVSLFLPIRAAQQPAINEGEPTCDSTAAAATAVFTLGRTGCPALAASLTREQYGHRSVLVDPTSSVLDPQPRSFALLTHQLLNYFQYFDWQWARGLASSELPGNRRLPVSLAILGLGLWGLLASVRSHRAHGLYLAVLIATLSIGLVLYLNFRYGYSLGSDTIDYAIREVRERDYFFVASFQLWGFLAGAGLIAAWRWLAGTEAGGRRLLVTSPVLGVALLPLVFNWSWASRAGDHSAQDFAYDLLQSVEPYGILFTGGDNDTFPLWYLQEVERVRQDVTVIVGEYLDTDWYPRQLRDRTAPGRQRPYREDGLGVYAAPDAPPTRPITLLTDAQLAGAGSVLLGQSFTTELGSMTVQYPEGFQFTRGSQIALAIIQDSIAERPIHFASTGAMADRLGLAGWSVRQGIATKLRGPQPDPGVFQVASELGGEWVDLGRSLELAREVFRYRGLENRRVWADMASANIPAQLYLLHMQLADAAAQAGESQETVDALVRRAEGFAITALGGSRAMRGG